MDTEHPTDDRPRRKNILWQYLGLGPLLWIGAHVALLGWSMSRVGLMGADGTGLHTFMGLCGYLVMLGNVLGVVVGPLLGSSADGSSHGRRRVGWMAAGAASAVLLYAGASLETRLLNRHLPRVEAAAAPLIAAVDAYAADNDKFPATVAPLVPRYIDGVPSAVIPAAKEFHYQRAPWKSCESWSLRVLLSDRYYVFDGATRNWRSIPTIG